jgi:DNA repair exonuclease SbcCD nuclease subunit
MEKVYIGSIIADIHGGAIPPNILLEELKKKYLDELRKLSILDFVIIAGDLFDTKISLNSEHTKIIFTFIHLLMDICIEKGAKLRIIKGTESHDNKQLELFNFMNTECDMKIITEVTSEMLFENMKVLYIPEEYMNDYKEYYKDYFNDKYDMIFGHGLVEEVAFAAKLQTSEMTMSRAPIFKSSDLLNISHGPIFFGHIHKKQIIGDRFYYTGSFSVWTFGEEESKGSYLVSYSPISHNYEIDFIENTMARKYVTMIIDEKSNIYKQEDCDIDYILKLVDSIPADKIRLIFNIPESYTNFKLLNTLVRDTFSKTSNIKIVMNNKKNDVKNIVNMERVKALINTYDFIYNRKLPLEDKIVKYIKIRSNVDISVSDMRDMLYQKLDY